MLRITVLLVSLFWLLIGQVQACICVPQDLMVVASADDAYVFEGSLVCTSNNQDLALLVNQEFYVFKVYRYWNDRPVPEYVVLTNNIGTSCSAYFNSKTGRYIIAAPRNQNGLFPVNQCNVMPVGDLTQQLILKHGDGQLVEKWPEENPYTNFCKKNRESERARIEMSVRLEKLEKERIWYTLQLHSFLVGVLVLLVCWLISRFMPFPLTIILKAIGFAVFLGLLLTNVLAIVLSNYLPPAPQSGRLVNGFLGIYRYLWDCLQFAGLLVALTLPAFLNRLKWFKKRHWIKWLGFLLLPGLMFVLTFRIVISLVHAESLMVHYVLNMFCPFAAFFYLAFLLFYLKKVHREKEN